MTIPSSANPEVLAQATGHLQAGRLDQADAACRRILQQYPDDAPAHQVLGIIALRRGQKDTALTHMQQAAELAPKNAMLQASLGEIHGIMGQFEPAVAAFQRALTLSPRNPNILLSLGKARLAARDFAEAVHSFQQALAVKPDFYDAVYMLGRVLDASGHPEQAAGAYRRALEMKPDQAGVCNNLGIVLTALGRYDEAIAALRRAVELQPQFVSAYNNLGNALADARRTDEAIAVYRQALQIGPLFAPAHNNLGTAFKDAGKLDEATAAFRKATECQPDYAEAHNQLAAALTDMGKFDEAVVSFRRAIALAPDHPRYHSNLILNLNFHTTATSSDILQEAHRWADNQARPLADSIQAHPNDRAPDRLLRIGYVSADFCRHACALFLVPLFEHHDPRQFELYGYAEVEKPDEITERLQNKSKTWRSTVGLPDARIAEMVREDKIDILVDLKLHTDKNRLLVFARKPAPIQVTWLGYPGTTGLDTIDYRLTDPYLDPPPTPAGSPETHDDWYSEKSFRLPDTFWCYDPLTSEPAVNALPANTADHVTFGCLNNSGKLNDHVLALWGRVLAAVPGSRLMLLAAESSQRQRILATLQSHGIAADRIEFALPRPRPQYLELYHHIDLGLDAVPYNGHTTSLDAYWMGVPVVTLVGATVVGRAGLSQLMNLGLPELVARTADEFVALATGLASDLPRLSALRSTLRPRMQASPLMDAPRFARNIEAAYRQMWRQWCARPAGVGGGA